MVGRIWDAFYDPVIGYISDRTTTRMGRRRPFMLGGAIPWFIAMVVMFTNPSLITGSGISQAALFAYALIVYMVLCTAYSTVNIPYYSWAPELTSDYHERTSLNGYRSGFAFLGNLLALGAALPIVALCKDKSTGFVLMGLIFGGVMLVTTLATVLTVKEPASLKPAKSLDIWKTYREVLRRFQKQALCPHPAGIHTQLHRHWHHRRHSYLLLQIYPRRRKYGDICHAHTAGDLGAFHTG